MPSQRNVRRRREEEPELAPTVPSLLTRNHQLASQLAAARTENLRLRSVVRELENREILYRNSQAIYSSVKTSHVRERARTKASLTPPSPPPPPPASVAPAATRQESPSDSTMPPPSQQSSIRSDSQSSTYQLPGTISSLIERQNLEDYPHQSQPLAEVDKSSENLESIREEKSARVLCDISTNITLDSTDKDTRCSESRHFSAEGAGPAHDKSESTSLEDDTELVHISGRRRRAVRSTVSYKEPSARSKIRKGHEFFKTKSP